MKIDLISVAFNSLIKKIQLYSVVALNMAYILSVLVCMSHWPRPAPGHLGSDVMPGQSQSLSLPVPARLARPQQWVTQGKGLKILKNMKCIVL